jgi:hypothetical protein
VSDTWFCQTEIVAKVHRKRAKNGSRAAGRSLRWCGGVERTRVEWTQQADERSLVKGQQKPKQLAKKVPQKTLKEKRQEKKAKKKAGGAFDH